MTWFYTIWANSLYYNLDTFTKIPGLCVYYIYGTSEKFISQPLNSEQNVLEEKFRKKKVKENRKGRMPMVKKKTAFNKIHPDPMVQVEPQLKKKKKRKG